MRITVAKGPESYETFQSKKLLLLTTVAFFNTSSISLTKGLGRRPVPKTGKSNQPTLFSGTIHQRAASSRMSTFSVVVSSIP